MGCWSRHDSDRWSNKMERMQYKMDRMRGRMERGGWGFGPPTSGNRAFDEYRVETLRRLEEEQVEFKNFLDRLRHAKDKEEFDQFMAQHKTASDAAERPAARTIVRLIEVHPRSVRSANKTRSSPSGDVPP